MSVLHRIALAAAATRNQVDFFAQAHPAKSGEQIVKDVVERKMQIYLRSLRNHEVSLFALQADLTEKSDSRGVTDNAAMAIAIAIYQCE